MLAPGGLLVRRFRALASACDGINDFLPGKAPLLLCQVDRELKGIAKLACPHVRPHR
jgi:hypothetical protein